MPASLNRDGNSYKDFDKGVSFETIPPSAVTHGQIVRNFGMQPPGYWLESRMSTPGPMTGGAPILSPTQFSHGIMW